MDGALTVCSACTAVGAASRSLSTWNSRRRRNSATATEWERPLDPCDGWDASAAVAAAPSARSLNREFPARERKHANIFNMPESSVAKHSISDVYVRRNISLTVIALQHSQGRDRKRKRVGFMTEALKHVNGRGNTWTTRRKTQHWISENVWLGDTQFTAKIYIHT